MSDAMHNEVLSVLQGLCNNPKSQRNPFAGRCQLPAGHNGPHQWDRQPMSTGPDERTDGQVPDRMTVVSSAEIRSATVTKFQPHGTRMATRSEEERET